MTSWPTNWVNWVTTINSWQLFTLWTCRQLEVELSCVAINGPLRPELSSVEFSWVELYRYKRAFSFLLLECSAFSGRSRPPMTPVFSIISSFLDVYIPCRCSSTSLSLYHSVSHESLTLPFCLLRLYAEGIHFSTHDLTIFLSLSDGVHEASVFIHHVQNLLIGSV